MADPFITASTPDRTNPGSVDVLVALPAHTEADTISICLEAIGQAAQSAKDSGLIRRCRIAVSAHRCTDDTALLAQQTLAQIGHVESLVITEEADLRVGEVRTRLITTAHQHPASMSSNAWIFSTDADTIVPESWITEILTEAHRTQADLVLGLADLMDWDADVDDLTRASYERIITAGLTDTGHTHAYAANLAFTWQAFSSVGGFPAVVHGEEHALAARMRSAGYTVISPLSSRVQTSARMPGRVNHGLGTLLADLASARTQG